MIPGAFNENRSAFDLPVLDWRTRNGSLCLLAIRVQLWDSRRGEVVPIGLACDLELLDPAGRYFEVLALGRRIRGKGRGADTLLRRVGAGHGENLASAFARALLAALERRDAAKERIELA
jgi:hypothetical protein